MSEFSSYYVLGSNDTQEAVRLIRSAECKGYVLPEKNGWVTFTIDEERFGRCNPAITAACTNTLGYMVNTEDHGWEFTLYTAGQEALYYSCRFNEETAMAGFDPDNPFDFEPPDPATYPPFVYDFRTDWALSEKALAAMPNGKKKLETLKTCIEEAEKCSREPRFGAALFNEKGPGGAAAFSEAMGFFFNEWISYSYLESDDRREGQFNYGRLGIYPLISV